MINRFILLGASRGLGWATYQRLCQQKTNSFLLSSRKIALRQNEINAGTQLIEQDFSKIPVDHQFLAELQKFDPTHLIYFAGGGPHGNFAEKKWTDHVWALNTSFLYPAELLHLVLSQKSKWPSLKQFVLIGSEIAENKPDPLASSYAAAKHALRGLVHTIQGESDSLHLQLFSPGYMQTDLLPANSQPRQNNSAESPVDVAKKLIAMMGKKD